MVRRPEEDRPGWRHPHLGSRTGRSDQCGRPRMLHRPRPAAIRPKNGAHPGYILHALRYFEPQLVRLGSGSTFAAITTRDLIGLPLTLPPLAEQQRIAAILDKADALRRKRQAAITRAEVLEVAMFFRLFGDPLQNPHCWTQRRIEEVADVQGGIQLSSKRAHLPLKKPYLRVANVQRGYLDLTEIKMIGLTPEEHARTRLQAGDLLLVEGNGNSHEIGRCAAWNGAVADCVHQNHLIRVRCDGLVHPTFLNAWLNSPAGKAYYLRSGRTTSGLVTISTGLVKACPVLVPPMALLERFADWTTRVQVERQKQVAWAAECDRLFCGLQRLMLGPPNVVPDP